jgi:hypothetical protein
MDLRGTGTAFLQHLSDALGFPEQGYVERMLSEWMKGDVIWKPRHWLMPVEELWRHAEQEEESRNFASLAGCLVCCVPSESEVERVTSIQRDIQTAKASRMGESVFNARTILRQPRRKDIPRFEHGGRAGRGAWAADTGGTA